MDILYLFRDLPTVMYQWQHYHIIDELSNYGCYFDIVSPDDFDSLEHYYESVINKTNSKHYQIIMTCLGDSFLTVDFVEQLRSTGSKTLLFCPDNLVVPFNHRNIAPHFDLVWLTSVETEYLFKRWGCNTVFLPYAANPNFLSPPSDKNVVSERKRRVCFVGTPHGSRIKTINLLLDNNVPVTIFCSKQYAEQRTKIQASPSEVIHKALDKIRFSIGRKLLLALIIDKVKREELHTDSSYLEIKEPVPITDLPKIYNSYYIVLSFSEAESSAYLKKPVDIVNLRNFEIPMSGGVQFVRATEELKRYFQNNEEIIFYTNEDDMPQIAKHILTDYADDKIREISNKARSVAEKNHAWVNRFKVVFSALNINIEQ